MSDSRFATSDALWTRAQATIAGGVTSAVRATARPHPMYFDRGAGAELWDVDGNRYVDFALAYGPLILGHSSPVIREAVVAQLERGTTFGAQHRSEVLLGELLAGVVPGAERSIVATTGSEAVAAALRIARAVTARPRVVKFEGHYHGWFDGIFVNVTAASPDRWGSSVDLPIVPATAGMAPGSLGDVLVAPWNDLPTLEHLFRRHGDEIAAVICEPVAVNGGLIEPVPGFLAALRNLATEYGALLIFDEVITGFRIALGGAQEHFGVAADLAIFAKAIAGGLPISAVTGSADHLEVVASGRVVHNGTFNGNPVATSAAIATLGLLASQSGAVYPRLQTLGMRLATGLAATHERLTVRVLGPIVHTAVDEPTPVLSVRDRSGGRPELHARWIEALLLRGIHATPRGLWYLSTAHREEHVDEAIAAAAEAAREVLD